MNISNEWTNEERLKAIGILTAGALNAATHTTAAAFKRQCALTETANLLATKPAEFLENNRAAIEEDLRFAASVIQAGAAMKPFVETMVAPHVAVEGKE